MRLPGFSAPYWPTMLSKYLVIILAGFFVLACSGCSSIYYYSQAAGGQLSLLQQRSAVDTLIDDPSTSAELRAALLRVEAIRTFAGEALALPVGDTYSSYVDLEREAVVWNLLVAPVDSLELKAWCYPIVGCQTYRGYFSRKVAEAAAQRFAPEQWDVWIAGIPAYSSLGWFEDPLLSTFIFWPEDQLAALLFHELSHKLVYVAGDTVFNESYATAVELEGLLRYLNASGQTTLIADALARQDMAQEFTEMVMSSADALQQLYREPDLPHSALVAQKERLIAELRARYDKQRHDWLKPNAYRAFFDDGLNNARIASVGTYNRWVPAFRRLLAEKHGDFAAFHRTVGELARMEGAQRTQRLEQLQSAAFSR
ncbi:MAG: hypothetical protein CL583_02965 [Alteromonadaceae bacterium]|nr:hypothetical protein [Alteromonadaceae bacterium]